MRQSKHKTRNQLLQNHQSTKMIKLNPKIIQARNSNLKHFDDKTIQIIRKIEDSSSSKEQMTKTAKSCEMLHP